jgi:hypothetical protein
MFEDLRGELLSRFLSTPFTFVLEDHAGPWWTVSVKSHNSALTLTVNGSTLEIPPKPMAQHTFHLFLDASVAELIVDRRQAITSRIYRQPDGPLCIKPNGEDLLSLVSLDAWELRPISPDRLTT